MRVSWRLTAVVVLLLPLLASAQMSSTNYTVPGDAFGGGGSYSSSTNYQAIDTLTESMTPPEQGMSSTNYIACAGFQCVASGDKSITAVITTSTSACTSSTVQSNPMTQSLGTLSAGSVATAADRICVIVTATQVGSVSVTVRDTNSGLKSTSTPADVIPSASATLVAGTTGYGVCASNAISGFTKVSPFNGSCDTSSGHAVGALSTTSSSIFTSAGDVTNAVGEILTKAAISTLVPGHADYGDTITVIVTGTF